MMSGCRSGACNNKIMTRNTLIHQNNYSSSQTEWTAQDSEMPSFAEWDACSQDFILGVYYL